MRTANHFLGFDTRGMIPLKTHIVQLEHLGVVQNHVVGDFIEIAIAYGYQSYLRGDYQVVKYNYQDALDVIKAYERFNICLNPETIALHLNIDEPIIYQ